MTATPLWGLPAEVEIYGERLRDARVIQRLKAGAVAQSAGISPDRYSRLESSLSTTVAEPRARQLAMALGFPVDFLTTRPITPVQRGSLLFRAKKNMSRTEEEQLVAWSRLLGDLLRSASTHARLPYVRTPRPIEGTTPKRAAQMTREAFGIKPYEPIAHLVRVLERAGVYVARLGFTADLHTRHHDAFSTWVGPAMDWPLLVLRDSAGWERSRLSAAHELGHLVLHHTRRDGDLEGEAFEFAAEFLLPLPMLIKEWPDQPTILSLLALKSKWGMSLAALIEHGHRNGLLNDNVRMSLYKQLSNRRDRSTGQSWRVAEPGWNDREPERPKLIGKVAEIAFPKIETLEDLGDLACHWRGDFMHQALSTQATEWVRQHASTGEQESGLEESLAEVVQLRRPSPHGSESALSSAK